MSERYNREKHCGFGEPIWNFNDILGKESPVLDLTSTSLFSSPIDNTINANFINVRKVCSDKGKEKINDCEPVRIGIKGVLK